MEKQSTSKTHWIGMLFVPVLLLSGLAEYTAHAAFLNSSGQPLPFPIEEHESPLSSPGDAFGSIVSDQEIIDHGDEIISDWANEETLAAIDEPLIEAPNVFNDSVEFYLAYFQTNIRDRLSIWLERSGRYLPIMRETFQRYGLPKDLVYMSLIESGFNPSAHSRAHAVGPWQFMKGTGRLYGLKINRWIDERRDPIKSTDAAARHLKDLYERFDSWPLALASYNAGPRKIQRALSRAKADTYWQIRKTRYIRRETKGYVPKFIAATLIAKNPERYGFNPEYYEPFDYDEVAVPAMASLKVIARAAGISFKELKGLNPELRTEITPPTISKYMLRLPSGSKEDFEIRYADIPEGKKVFRTRYIVKRNDTLSGIARRYGTSTSLLAKMNHRSTRRVLRVGEALYIPKMTPRPSRHRPRKYQIKTVSGPSAKSGTKQIVYRVQAGDTLWDISRSFKVSLSSLKQNNDLGRRGLIYPGDMLILGFKE